MGEPIWPDRATVSAETLVRERAERVAWHEEHFGPAPAEFTCDECSHAASCALAFDSYNTNGDCLADK